jgi:hypothetical protein
MISATEVRREKMQEMTCRQLCSTLRDVLERLWAEREEKLSEYLPEA